MHKRYLLPFDENSNVTIILINFHDSHLLQQLPPIYIATYTWSGHPLGVGHHIGNVSMNSWLIKLSHQTHENTPTREQKVSPVKNLTESPNSPPKLPTHHCHEVGSKLKRGS